MSAAGTSTSKSQSENEGPRGATFPDFDNLDLAGKLEAMRGLGARAQAALFEACAPNEPVAIADLLPATPRPGVTYIWEGVNSLPAFRRFQKRFTRTDEEGRLAGYNHQGLMWLVGPGCFVAHAAGKGAPGAVVIDYTMTPGGQPAGWPRVVPAGKGLSRFVYGGMHDYMRRVTKDVLIGWAWKHGKPTGNYFLLARGGEA